MKVPAWLAEFYRQWYEARGKKLEPRKRSFSRRWETLLDDAGLRSAAERSNAVAEADALRAGGHLELGRHRYRRYLIESVALPASSEPWLLALFGKTSAQELCGRAMAVVTRCKDMGHRRWPESWQTMNEKILAAFEKGGNRAPFFWNDPVELEHLLSILHKLTEREWPEGILIREVSRDLGLGSKGLGERQRPLESALRLLFEEKTGLESLGILCAQSRVTIHGPLSLHFEDGKIQRFEHLRGDITISFSDLQRCVQATTSAGRVLTIENSKTPFPRAVAANRQGDTLLVATSFPNSATRRLLNLLPFSLPHYHFGDTDASGYAILKSLREIGVRPVERFLMNWRDYPESPPLSEYDLRILESLKRSPLMEDCLPFLLEMERAGRKGFFEQENEGSPIFDHWPFWKI